MRPGVCRPGWEKLGVRRESRRDAPENPILQTTCRAHGPGHNSLVDVGGQTWIVYHAWLPHQAGNKRVLWIDKLDWKGGKPAVHGPTCTAQSAP